MIIIKDSKQFGIYWICIRGVFEFESVLYFAWKMRAKHATAILLSLCY